jgi:hypothetical protein
MAVIDFGGAVLPYGSSVPIGATNYTTAPNPTTSSPLTQNGLDAYNQFSMNYATMGNPNGPSVGRLGPSYQDWTNAGSPTDYQGYVNYFDKPQNPTSTSTPSVGIVSPAMGQNPDGTWNYGTPQPATGSSLTNSTQLPSNWQSTYNGPSAAMIGWQPSIQDYAANNSAGFTLPSNYSSPSVGLSTPVTGGGLSSLVNSGTSNMATNPLSTYSTPAPTTGYTPAPNLNVTPGSAGGSSFGQGSILPNVTSTQQQVTAAPSFYTDYLNQLASKGQQATSGSQYVGAQPLQEQAFNQVAQNVGNYQPTLQNAINLAGSVGQSNLAQAIGDVGQANIANYLAPQATAGLVGSGQFGSSRGARALGDTIANAELGLTAQQAQAMQQDYANRLAAAQQLGSLAGQTQSLGLGDINALSSLGGQQQTIAQNEQLFPMQQLTNMSQLLRGYTIPTSVSASQTGPGQQGQFAMSPLQQIATIGTLAGALAQPSRDYIDPVTGKLVPGTSAGKNIISGLGNVLDKGLTYAGKLFEPSYNTMTGLTGNESTNLDYFNANPTDLSYLDTLG